MEQNDHELEKAREELSFWRDYAAWWNRSGSESPEPRIREALDRAEARYRSAMVRRGMSRLP